MHENDAPEFMSRERNETLSIIIPAYNEAERIAPTLRSIDAYCRQRFPGYELIVVDDGSSDSTLDVVKGESAAIPALRYIISPENHGKGHAIRVGIRSCKGDVILVSDADLSTPIGEVEKMLSCLEEGCDIAIGSRALHDSELLQRQPWWREAMGRTFNVFVRALVQMEFRDTQCGFKLFRGECARSIFSRARIDGFAYDVEILYLARKAGCTIREIPVRWRNSPVSKVNPVRDSMRMLRDLVILRLRSPR